MMYVIEQTRDEKIAVYMRMTKRDLAEMLFNTNAALAAVKPFEIFPQPSTTWATVTINTPPPTVWG